MTIEWSFQNLTDGKKNQCRQRLTLGSSPTYKCPYVQGLGLETCTTAEDSSPDQESFNWKGRNLVLLTQQKEKSGLEFDSTSDHTKCQTLLGQGGWEVSLPPSIQLKFPILETIFLPWEFQIFFRVIVSPSTRQFIPLHVHNRQDKTVPNSSLILLVIH